MRRTITKSRSLARRTQVLAQHLLPYYRDGEEFGIHVKVDGIDHGITHVLARKTVPEFDVLKEEVAEVAASITTIDLDARKLEVYMICAKCLHGKPCVSDRPQTCTFSLTIAKRPSK